MLCISAVWSSMVETVIWNWCVCVCVCVCVCDIGWSAICRCCGNLTNLQSYCTVQKEPEWVCVYMFIDLSQKRPWLSLKRHWEWIWNNSIFLMNTKEPEWVCVYMYIDLSEKRPWLSLKRHWEWIWNNSIFLMNTKFQDGWTWAKNKYTIMKA